MKKIPTVFERDWNGDRSRVLDQPVESCAWVFAGEGVATRKYDGTCCLVRDGALWKRHEVREGKNEPPGFVEVDFDSETGKRIGWVPVGDGPEDKWHRQAFDAIDGTPKDGTYELLGPKVQGNSEGFDEHVLLRHADADLIDGIVVDGDPRAFDELAELFSIRDIEGIVWHHPDGRMAKIKAKDFGIKRGVATRA